MRIRRIDLIRYGRFTGATVDLPEGVPDMHIVVGPNESGKSTVLRAFEDVLFGIPARTAMGFRHGYSEMRLGASIESNGHTLDFKRRKGNKNTVLSDNNTPMPGGQGRVASLLGSTDPNLFKRMFSLDHNRLRKGGKEILEAKGDLGEALFAAGSGLQDLGKVRGALASESKDIWTKRRSAKRKFYQIKDRIDEARRAFRENSVSARIWQTRRKEFERCRDAAAVVQRELESAEARLRKNSRIRRVARPIRNKALLEAELRGLAGVADFPEDARDSLLSAEQDHRIASRRAADQSAELERVRRERASLEWNDSVLLRADSIERLVERLSVARKGKEDLPKRRAELEVAEERLLELGAELGWESQNASDLETRIPPRRTVADARRILSELDKSTNHVTGMEKALNEAEIASRAVERDLSAVRVPADVSKLAPLISATRDQFGDLGARIHSAQSDAAEAAARAGNLAKRMQPGVGSAASAGALAVPTQAEVFAIRDTQADLDRRLEECRNQIRDADLDIARRQADRHRIKRNEQPVSREQVIELRERRDVGWRLVRRIHVEREPVGEEEVLAFTGGKGDLAPEYESAVVEADQAIDRSVETASAAARLEEAEHAIQKGKILRAALNREQSELESRSSKIEAKWTQLWKSVPIEPLGPEAMLSWLELHTELRQALASQARRLGQLADLRRRESRAVAALEEELGRLGVKPDSLRSRGLRYVLDLVADLQRNYSRAADKYAQLKRDRDRAVQTVAARRRDLDAARSDEANWRAMWADIRTRLDLRAGLTAASAEADFEIIDQMRDARGTAEDLRAKRIGMIRKDIDRFAADVSEIVSAIDTGLCTWSPDEVVPELKRRLDAAKGAKREAARRDEQIKRIEEQIRQHEADVRHADDKIAKLHALSGTQSVDDLRIEIGKAERRRDLQEQVAEAEQVLMQDGDGLAITDLEVECEGIDLDLASAQEADLVEQIRKHRQQLDEARTQLREAEANFSKVGGGDAGAIAEAARQGALAEMREVAERYVRTRSAELLLGWAIDRNRREKQGPMLKRAGALFRDLTLGSFEALELDYDRQDRPRLVGRRPDDERVAVDGMSEGSVDQLYLALRIAALEDYVGREQRLPFIADDLFINFDDSRAEAGLKLLGQLAERCQVIFFTHHDHLAEIARDALNGKAREWHLE